ncbi:MAG: lipid A core--O-antigen ligase [Oscillatoriales cyanobacterium CG2_30_44_21]|nr:MAG: lipid A core--O-antigen ligase [Oscillatoriales cyanobacterium CG2_30_44_21]
MELVAGYCHFYGGEQCVYALCGGGLEIWVLSSRGWRSLATPINIAYFWLSIWMTLSTFTAFDVGIAAGGLANFLPYFLLAATTSYVVRTSAQFIHLMWLFVLSSLLVSSFGILQALIDRPDWIFPKVIFDSYPIPMGFSSDRRIQSFFGHFNETAIYLLMILPIAFHFAVGKVKSITKSQRVIAAIALALGISVLIMTGSRNAWGLALIGAVLVAIYYRQWKLVVGFAVITLAIAWAVFGSRFGLGGEGLRSLLPQGFVNRLISTVDPRMGDFASTSDRLNAWQFASSLISEHPIQGWGLRNFTKVAASMNFNLRGLPHEHNLFLAIAVGSGIPALIAFVGILGKTIWLASGKLVISETEGISMIVAIAVILFLLSCCLDLVLYEPRISMLLWYFLGSLEGVATQKSNDR